MSQKISLHILASVLAVLLSPAFAAELTDAQAKQIAVHMGKTIEESRVKLNALIVSGHREKYRDSIRQPLQDLVNAWPGNTLKGRAIFPYFSCEQAAIKLLQYGDSWAWIAQSAAWRDHIMTLFLMDHAACNKAIKHPDLNLKNVQ